MCSIDGCGSTSQISRASAMRTMPFATVRRWSRRSSCAPRWSSALRNVIWNCMRRKPGWCTARTMIVGGLILTTALTFWALRLGHGAQRTGGASSSSVLLRRSVTRLRRRCEARCEAGACITGATSRSKIWQGCSTRWLRAGLTTTADSTSRRFIPRCATWTWCWPGGRRRNTKSCGATFGEPGTGWRVERKAGLVCSLTGSSCSGRLDNGSGVSREAHAPFCESLRVRFPRATHLVMLFAYKDDAQRVLEVLGKRVRKYGLELHPDKTTMVDFRYKPKSAKDEGGKVLATSFNFLGFTHVWVKSRT